MAVSRKSEKELVDEIKVLRSRLEGLERSEAECKKAENALQETTQFFETILDTTHILIAYLDPQFNFIKVNKAYALADEKKPSFFPGKNHFDLYPNEENEAIFRRVVETGESYFTDAKPFEYAGHPERGVSYWDWSLISIKNQHSSVTGLLLSLANVTERKQAEEALRESEGKLSAMLQSLGDHMSMMDKDLNIIWANEKARNIFGDDIVGMKCYKAYHQRNKPCEPYPCLTLKAFQDGKVHKHDTQVVDKDGNTRYFHCSANLALRDEQGNPTAVLEISKDITKQKLAEEALRESENSYRAVVENAVEGIVVVQGQTLQFVNPAIVSMMGYSEKELLTRPFIEFIHPDHREWTMGIHIKRLKGEEVPPIYELKAIDKKGNTRWLENNGILINWGNKPATLNFLRDITERKKAEQAIWASESEKKSILNAISDQLLFHDTDLTIRWVNEASARSIGMTQRELVGCYCYELWHGRSEPCERC
ncbi:MAG: PAS domain S-box protein, partial [Desulfobacteraceae bacterium]|nr:PAS domain S-box protein [Desulfobacteraceae bacterium]